MRIVLECDAWESEGRKVVLRVDTAQSPPRVIDASTSQPNAATEWNTFLFGSESTAPFLTATKSTTLTETSSTTRSKTLSWLLHWSTNGSIPDVSFGTESGLSHAENAGPFYTSVTFTSGATVSPPGASRVASGTRWRISASGVVPQNVNDGRKTSIDNPYQRGDTVRLSSHPTVKPVDLCRWLATLLLPPPLDRPRRILVPFSGSGSEMIGCLLAGWDEVIGVELSEEYAEIARARLTHWERYRRADSEAAEKEAAGQTSIFDLDGV